MSSEHENSKNNMNLAKFRPWLTEMDCFIFQGRLAWVEANRCLKKLLFISSGLPCWLLLFKVDFEYDFFSISLKAAKLARFQTIKHLTVEGPVRRCMRRVSMGV